MIRQSRTAPCFGYPLKLLFPDVEPEVLAQEDAAERSAQAMPPGTWQAYLRRTLDMTPERRDRHIAA